MGHYAEVAILAMPDDASYARFTLGTASHGWVRTEALRGFAKKEWQNILVGLASEDTPAQDVHKPPLRDITLSDEVLP